MADRIQLRRDTASDWTSINPTLTSGELGLETDTGKLKLGTGALAWNSASYCTLATAGYAPLASPTFTGTPTTPVIKLTPTATSSAPTGSEGALYYDSDKDTLMKFTGDNVWNDVHSTFMKAKGKGKAKKKLYKVVQ